MKFEKRFRKTVWGWFEVEAESKEEAEEKLLNGDFDEFDNKSDYEPDDEWVEK